MDEISGKGAFAVRNWKQIQQAGGEAPGPAEILQFLREGGVEKAMQREEIIDRVYGYFMSCLEEFEDAETFEKGYRWRKNPTKNGLARALGVSNQTLSRYLAGEYRGTPYKPNATNGRHIIDASNFDVIQAAASLIEEFYEGLLAQNRNPAGPIFWLKNAHSDTWADSQDVNLYAPAAIDSQSREQIAAKYIAFAEIEDGEDDGTRKAPGESSDCAE